MTRIFYDTEFIDTGSHIDLISIGMVTDEGREYYAVSNEFSMKNLVRNDWLVKNVFPSLPQVRGDERMRVLVANRAKSFGGQVRLHNALFNRYDPAVKTRAEIAVEVADFVTAYQDPALWAWYGAYDHVVLAQLYGPMANLPKGMPMHTNDLKQECKRLGNPPMPVQLSGVHNALDDARHNRVMAKFLDGLAASDRR